MTVLEFSLSFCLKENKERKKNWDELEVYLEPSRTSTMELFMQKYPTAKNHYFRKKARS